MAVKHEKATDKKKINISIPALRFKYRALFYKVATDYRKRTILSAVPGMVTNIIFAAFNGVMAAMSGSVWFLTLAIYYMLLGVMRAGIVIQERKIIAIKDKEEHLEKERKIYRINSALFIFMAMVLAGAVILLEHSEGGKKYPGVLIYAVALYAFYKIVSSTIQYIKVGKRNSLILSITRKIGYIDACVSILMLQTAMFSSFANGQESFETMMNGATGCAVCFMVFIFGIYGFMLPVRLNRKRNVTK